nr:ORF1a [Chinook salmon bafinivirus]
MPNMRIRKIAPKAAVKPTHNGPRVVSNPASCHIYIGPQLRAHNYPSVLKGSFKAASAETIIAINLIATVRKDAGISGQYAGKMGYDPEMGLFVSVEGVRALQASKLQTALKAIKKGNRPFGLFRLKQSVTNTHAQNLLALHRASSTGPWTKHLPSQGPIGNCLAEFMQEYTTTIPPFDSVLTENGWQYAVTIDGVTKSRLPYTEIRRGGYEFTTKNYHIGAIQVTANHIGKVNPGVTELDCQYFMLTRNQKPQNFTAEQLEGNIHNIIFDLSHETGKPKLYGMEETRQWAGTTPKPPKKKLRLVAMTSTLSATPSTTHPAPLTTTRAPLKTHISICPHNCTIIDINKAQFAFDNYTSQLPNSCVHRANKAVCAGLNADLLSTHFNYLSKVETSKGTYQWVHFSPKTTAPAIQFYVLQFQNHVYLRLLPMPMNLSFRTICDIETAHGQPHPTYTSPDWRVYYLAKYDPTKVLRVQVVDWAGSDTITEDHVTLFPRRHIMTKVLKNDQTKVNYIDPTKDAATTPFTIETVEGGKVEVLSANVIRQINIETGRGKKRKTAKLDVKISIRVKATKTRTTIHVFITQAKDESKIVTPTSEMQGVVDVLISRACVLSQHAGPDMTYELHTPDGSCTNPLVQFFEEEGEVPEDVYDLFPSVERNAEGLVMCMSEGFALISGCIPHPLAYYADKYGQTLVPEFKVTRTQVERGPIPPSRSIYYTFIPINVDSIPPFGHTYKSLAKLNTFNLGWEDQDMLDNADTLLPCLLENENMKLHLTWKIIARDFSDNTTETALTIYTDFTTKNFTPANQTGSSSQSLSSPPLSQLSSHKSLANLSEIGSIDNIPENTPETIQEEEDIEEEVTSPVQPTLNTLQEQATLNESIQSLVESVDSDVPYTWEQRVEESEVATIDLQAVELDQTPAPTTIQGHNFSLLLTGNTIGCHNSIIKLLGETTLTLTETSDQISHFILAFCPIVSRAGTDIQAAQDKIDTLSKIKPAIIIVLHHTFDVNMVTPESSTAITRSNTHAVDMLFHKDQGLLQCQKNYNALAKVADLIHLETPPKTSWLGYFQSLITWPTKVKTPTTPTPTTLSTEAVQEWVNATSPDLATVDWNSAITEQETTVTSLIEEISLRPNTNNTGYNLFKPNQRNNNSPSDYLSRTTSATKHCLINGLTSGSTILEVGCGYGKEFQKYKNSNIKVVALEPYHERYTEAAKKLPPNSTIYNKTLEEYNQIVIKEQIDALVSFNAIHYSTVTEALKACNLAKDQVVILTPNHDKLKALHDSNTTITNYKIELANNKFTFTIGQNTYSENYFSLQDFMIGMHASNFMLSSRSCTLLEHVNTFNAHLLIDATTETTTLLDAYEVLVFIKFRPLLLTYSNTALATNNSRTIRSALLRLINFRVAPSKTTSQVHVHILTRNDHATTEQEHLDLANIEIAHMNPKPAIIFVTSSRSKNNYTTPTVFFDFATLSAPTLPEQLKPLTDLALAIQHTATKTPTTVLTTAPEDPKTLPTAPTSFTKPSRKRYHCFHDLTTLPVNKNFILVNAGNPHLKSGGGITEAVYNRYGQGFMQTNNSMHATQLPLEVGDVLEYPSDRNNLINVTAPCINIKHADYKGPQPAHALLATYNAIINYVERKYDNGDEKHVFIPLLGAGYYGWSQIQSLQAFLSATDNSFRNTYVLLLHPSSVDVETAEVFAKMLATTNPHYYHVEGIAKVNANSCVLRAHIDLARKTSYPQPSLGLIGAYWMYTCPTLAAPLIQAGMHGPNTWTPGSFIDTSIAEMTARAYKINLVCDGCFTDIINFNPDQGLICNTCKTPVTLRTNYYRPRLPHMIKNSHGQPIPNIILDGIYHMATHQLFLNSVLFKNSHAFTINKISECDLPTTTAVATYFYKPSDALNFFLNFNAAVSANVTYTSEQITQAQTTPQLTTDDDYSDLDIDTINPTPTTLPRVPTPLSISDSSEDISLSDDTYTVASHHASKMSIPADTTSDRYSSTNSLAISEDITFQTGDGETITSLLTDSVLYYSVVTVLQLRKAQDCVEPNVEIINLRPNSSLHTLTHDKNAIDQLYIQVASDASNHTVINNTTLESISKTMCVKNSLYTLLTNSKCISHHIIVTGYDQHAHETHTIKSVTRQTMLAIQPLVQLTPTHVYSTLEEDISTIFQTVVLEHVNHTKLSTYNTKLHYATTVPTNLLIDGTIEDVQGKLREVDLGIVVPYQCEVDEQIEYTNAIGDLLYQNTNHHSPLVTFVSIDKSFTKRIFNSLKFQTLQNLWLYLITLQVFFTVKGIGFGFSSTEPNTQLMNGLWIQYGIFYFQVHLQTLITHPVKNGYRLFSLPIMLYNKGKRFTERSVQTMTGEIVNIRKPSPSNAVQKYGINTRLEYVDIFDLLHYTPGYIAFNFALLYLFSGNGYITFLAYTIQFFTARDIYRLSKHLYTVSKLTTFLSKFKTATTRHVLYATNQVNNRSLHLTLGSTTIDLLSFTSKAAFLALCSSFISWHFGLALAGGHSGEDYSRPPYHAVFQHALRTFGLIPPKEHYYSYPSLASACADSSAPLCFLGTPFNFHFPSSYTQAASMTTEHVVPFWIQLIILAPPSLFLVVIPWLITMFISPVLTFNQLLLPALAVHFLAIYVIYLYYFKKSCCHSHTCLKHAKLDRPIQIKGLFDLSMYFNHNKLCPRHNFYCNNADEPGHTLGPVLAAHITEFYHLKPGTIKPDVALVHTEHHASLSRKELKKHDDPTDCVWTAPQGAADTLVYEAYAHLKGVQIRIDANTDTTTRSMPIPMGAKTTSSPATGVINTKILGHLKRHCKNPALQSYLSGYVGAPNAKTTIMPITLFKHLPEGLKKYAIKNITFSINMLTDNSNSGFIPEGIHNPNNLPTKTFLVKSIDQTIFDQLHPETQAMLKDEYHIKLHDITSQFYEVISSMMSYESFIFALIIVLSVFLGFISYSSTITATTSLHAGLNPTMRGSTTGKPFIQPVTYPNSILIPLTSSQYNVFRLQNGTLYFTSQITAPTCTVKLPNPYIGLTTEKFYECSSALLHMPFMVHLGGVKIAYLRAGVAYNMPTYSETPQTSKLCVLTALSKTKCFNILPGGFHTPVLAILVSTCALLATVLFYLYLLQIFKFYTNSVLMVVAIQIVTIFLFMLSPALALTLQLVCLMYLYHNWMVAMINIANLAVLAHTTFGMVLIFIYALYRLYKVYQVTSTAAVTINATGEMRFHGTLDEVALCTFPISSASVYQIMSDLSLDYIKLASYKTSYNRATRNLVNMMQRYILDTSIPAILYDGSVTTGIMQQSLVRLKSLVTTVYKDNYSNICKILSTTHSRSTFCVGTFLNPTTVITCSHGILANSTITVSHKSTIYEATIESQRNDITILKLTTPNSAITHTIECHSPNDADLENMQINYTQFVTFADKDHSDAIAMNNTTYLPSGHFFAIGTESGESGSPYFFNNKLVGIHYGVNTCDQFMLASKPDGSYYIPEIQHNISTQPSFSLSCIAHGRKSVTAKNTPTLHDAITKALAQTTRSAYTNDLTIDHTPEQLQAVLDFLTNPLNKLGPKTLHDYMATSIQVQSTTKAQSAHIDVHKPIRQAATLYYLMVIIFDIIAFFLTPGSDFSNQLVSMTAYLAAWFLNKTCFYNTHVLYTVTTCFQLCKYFNIVYLFTIIQSYKPIEMSMMDRQYDFLCAIIVALLLSPILVLIWKRLCNFTWHYLVAHLVVGCVLCIHVFFSYRSFTSSTGGLLTFSEFAFNSPLTAVITATVDESPVSVIVYPLLQHVISATLILAIVPSPLLAATVYSFYLIDQDVLCLLIFLLLTSKLTPLFLRPLTTFVSYDVVILSPSAYAQWLMAKSEGKEYGLFFAVIQSVFDFTSQHEVELTLEAQEITQQVRVEVHNTEPKDTKDDTCYITPTTIINPTLIRTDNYFYTNTKKVICEAPIELSDKAKEIVAKQLDAIPHPDLETTDLEVATLIDCTTTTKQSEVKEIEVDDLTHAYLLALIKATCIESGLPIPVMNYISSQTQIDSVMIHYFVKAANKLLLKDQELPLITAQSDTSTIQETLEALKLKDTTLMNPQELKAHRKQINILKAEQERQLSMERKLNAFLDTMHQRAVAEKNRSEVYSKVSAALRMHLSKVANAAHCDMETTDGVITLCSAFSIRSVCITQNTADISIYYSQSTDTYSIITTTTVFTAYNPMNANGQPIIPTTDPYNPIISFPVIFSLKHREEKSEIEQQANVGYSERAIKITTTEHATGTVLMIDNITSVIPATKTDARFTVNGKGYKIVDNAVAHKARANMSTILAVLRKSTISAQAAVVRIGGARYQTFHQAISFTPFQTPGYVTYAGICVCQRCTLREQHECHYAGNFVQIPTNISTQGLNKIYELTSIGPCKHNQFECTTCQPDLITKAPGQVLVYFTAHAQTHYKQIVTQICKFYQVKQCNSQKHADFTIHIIPHGHSTDTTHPNTTVLVVRKHLVDPDPEPPHIGISSTLTGEELITLDRLLQPAVEPQTKSFLNFWSGW